MKATLILLLLVLCWVHCRSSKMSVNHASSIAVSPSIEGNVALPDPSSDSHSNGLNQYNELSSRLDIIAGKWYLKFTVKSRRLPKSALSKLTEQIIADCEREMQSTVRGYNGVEISYQDYLSELRSDIADLTVQKEDEETGEEESGGQPVAEWRRSRWFRATKWVAARALMVGVNFAQYELQRRLKIRAAERRLAEVPEFPLL